MRTRLQIGVAGGDAQLLWDVRSYGNLPRACQNLAAIPVRHLQHEQVGIVVMCETNARQAVGSEA